MWLAIALFILFLCVLDYLWKFNVNAKLAKLPGPINLPFIGGIWLYLNRKPEDLLKMAKELNSRYGPTIISWIVYIPAMFTSDLDFIQEILSHPYEIKKNRLYSLLSDWLGEGLLMSYGSKWLKRRRAITPTFHFKILEEFVKIFDRQAQTLVDKFAVHADGMKIVDIQQNIGLATLDVICETAMGVRIDAQTNESCEYVQLILEMVRIFLLRFVTMSYRNDFIFKILAPKIAKRQEQIQDALHAFTERIIKERRQEMLENGVQIKFDGDDDIGMKERMALLDVLLLSTIDGKPLCDAEIREEVDTFMFEGHDTTKSAIGFTLYCISREPEVQSKLYAEIKNLIGTKNQPKQNITYRQLMDLKYTEMVIREALRMYPPVPFIGRQITQDCYINGVCLPKGLSVMMALITMQNDPKYFPEPNRFLPERDGHENAFASVPFSAGPRNCIGQRFAMLEVKCFIARIIQSYELLPLGEPIEPLVTIILKSKTGWQMGFRKRD